jgi:hypothetical protein
VCPEICIQGCVCEPGYVLNNNDKCVKLEDCTNEIVCDDPNEEYLKCGTSCPLTCENLDNNNTNKLCTEPCVEGCFCKAGYVLNNNRKCVLPNECHPPPRK